MTDFNNLSTCLGLFYAQKLGNGIVYIYIFFVYIFTNLSAQEDMTQGQFLSGVQHICKVGDHSWGRPKGSIFNSYYTKM